MVHVGDLAIWCMLVLLTWWKRVRSGVPALTRPFSACRISTFFSNLNLVWSVKNWKGRFSKIKIQEVEPCEILGRRRGLWSKACQADTWDNAELLICIMKIQEIVDFLKRSFSLLKSKHKLCPTNSGLALWRSGYSWIYSGASSRRS